uniref:Uncharacterized protein n=1 Tax=Romanomermis culicivorax TaxID=13658 RepID=A0A915IHJ6_ROMCU
MQEQRKNMLIESAVGAAAVAGRSPTRGDDGNEGAGRRRKNRSNRLCGCSPLLLLLPRVAPPDISERSEWARDEMLSLSPEVQGTHKEGHLDKTENRFYV